MDIIVKIYQYFADGFNYMFTKWERVAPNFWQHLQIVGISLVIAIIIAAPLGLLISRARWRQLSTPVLGILGILYTIPSLAFLAFLVPVFGLTSITTIVVLVVYSQTMLVRNIALGFLSIDRSIIESARGMGMSGLQSLLKVELPLALPVIIAGVRIATLATISIATIGAWAGAETLGKLFQENNPRKSAAGIILVVLMALTADQGFRLLERLSSGYRKPLSQRTILKNQASLTGNEVPV